MWTQYINSMQYNVAPKKIDHSRGRVKLLDGDMFYSPNPPKNWDSVVRPRYHDPDAHIFTVRNGKPEVQYHDLLLPRWYTPRTAFLSFMVAHPIIVGYPFNRLAHIPAQDYTNGRYTLKAEGQDSWLRLEQDLLLATATLRDALKLPLFVDRPFAPAVFGFARSSPTHTMMKKRAALSRDWFQIWIALLSYFIARAGIHNDDPIPPWYILLQSRGFDEALLNGIRSSAMVDFSPDIPRVGTFLDLDAANAPPPPAWFIQFGVPVWYRLGTSSLIAAKYDPNHPLANLVPPPELIAAQLKPSLTTSPRPIPSSSRDLPGSHTSWQDFFARRAALNEQVLQKESAARREARLNRERQPPTRKTKVFEWMRRHDTEDNRLYRQPVPSKCFDDAFESYHPSQRRYDAFRNEWDLCDEFAPAPGGGYDSDDSDDDPGIFGDIQVEGYIPTARPTSPIRFTEQSDTWRPFFLILNNPIKSLSLRYGFVHPLTASARLPLHFTNAQRKSWTDILHLAGLSVDTDKKFPIDSFFDPNLIAFIDALRIGRRPSGNQWDLDRDNRHSIHFSDQLRNVVVGPSGGYVIHFSNPHFPWNLWLSNAADVLHICRVQQELPSQYDIGIYLVENGFRFRTLVCLGSTPFLTASLKLPVLPVRSPGYTFTQKDYDVYEQQRAALLATPRARAFLLRGGIAWRLARDSLSFDDALDGPSSVFDVYQSGYYVQRDGEFWGDNDISAVELNVLSGLHICFTGKKVCAILSIGTH
jgi:hypothetical protein